MFTNANRLEAEGGRVPPFTKVNFIPITPRIETGTNLNLDCIFTSPGISQSLLIAIPFCCPGGVYAGRGSSVTFGGPEEASRRWMDTTPGRLIEELTAPAEPAALESCHCSLDRFSFIRRNGHGNLWALVSWAAAAMGVLDAAHIYSPQSRCLKPNIPGQQSCTTGTSQERQSLS